MKRIAFLLALLFILIDVRAQIDNLDEEALQGTWKASVIDGAFDNVKNEETYSAPNGLILKDGNYTEITFLDGYPIYFKGYWLSSSNTGKYYLHLLPWNSGNPIINFRIVSFENDNLVIATYDGRGTLHLTKDSSANVRAASTDTEPDGKAYGLDGVEVPTPDAAKGIVIQNGKKTVHK